MIFDIRFVTEYTYSGPVVDNFNALRIQPATSDTQQPSDLKLRITPEARTTAYVDYFGTIVHEFEITEPHTRLSIDLSVRCRTRRPDPAPEGTWDGLHSPGYRDAGAEYLSRHESVRPHLDTLAALADRARGATPHESVTNLCALLPETYEYRQGVTYVGSTAADMLTAGAGVCQDFVHVSLAVLRGMGIACRYCSGYLFIDGGPGGASAEVETHAWFEALLPIGDGGGGAWVGFDPTNASPAWETHVKVGHGRWYSDVPPIRGIFRGPGGGELSARVTMTRLDGSNGVS